MADAARSVLVTGTSSGIGRATVERLAGAGSLVFAGLRDAGGAEDPNGRVVPLQLDVTDPGQIEAAELRRIFEVNVFAPILLTQALLPMLRGARGRVVIVGSVGGRVALPFGGPYHATKFALEGLADSLRLELRPQGVGVAIVEPGTISTPIWSKAGNVVEAQRARLDQVARSLYGSRLATFQDKLREADEGGDAAAEVAAKIVEALEGDGSRYPVGRGIGTITRLRSLIPDALFDRLVGSRIA